MPSNFFRTGLLLAALTGIFVAMGALVGGETGMLIAFAFALAMNLFTYWKSDSLVLKITGATPVDAATAPEFYGLVKDLATRAGLPMPRVFIVPHAQPNAFATGRSPKHAAVCATTGLLDMLTKEEVAGVIAHELAHVKNRDTLTMTLAASIGGAISMFANFLQISMLFGGSRNSRSGIFGTMVAAIAAPFAAMLVQMAISRSREYQADLVGAQICGNPLWLASALEKIQTAVRGNPNRTVQTVPALAHMFICNPLAGGAYRSFFSTHPATEERVARLRELAKATGATLSSMTPGRGLVPDALRKPTEVAGPVAAGPMPTGFAPTDNSVSNKS
jgi:heat shock protein HtpX